VDAFLGLSTRAIRRLAILHFFFCRPYTASDFLYRRSLVALNRLPASFSCSDSSQSLAGLSSRLTPMHDYGSDSQWRTFWGWSTKPESEPASLWSSLDVPSATGGFCRLNASRRWQRDQADNPRTDYFCWTLETFTHSFHPVTLDSACLGRLD
jgi:hypothetical protein